MKWLILIVAIVSEVVATTSLKASNGFTKLIPSIIVVIGYSAAFYFLSLALKDIPIGVAYAIWSGIGIVLVSIVGTIVYKQHLDMPAIIGMLLIGAGVIVMNVFSKSLEH